MRGMSEGCRVDEPACLVGGVLLTRAGSAKIHGNRVAICDSALLIPSKPFAEVVAHLCWTGMYK